MKKLFAEIMDINNKKKKYPLAKDGCVFFFTEDRKFFIYALYTKRDLSGKNLIEIDLDTYLTESENYKTLHKTDPVMIYMPTVASIKAITAFSSYKATVDNMSMEQLYRWNLGNTQSKL